jgi:hypothetical protein
MACAAVCDCQFQDTEEQRGRDTEMKVLDQQSVGKNSELVVAVEI